MKFEEQLINMEMSIKNTRFYNINDVKKANFNETSLKAKVKPVGNFSGDLKLPLKIKGELLRPGKYYTGNITYVELKKAFNKLVQDKRELLLFTTHEAFWGDHSNVNDVVGKLFNFSWNDADSSIVFEGNIYDESTALKVLNNVVKGISAGFTFENVNGVNSDIEISEGSLTFKPHCKTAGVTAVI